MDLLQNSDIKEPSILFLNFEIQYQKKLTFSNSMNIDWILQLKCVHLEN